MTGTASCKITVTQLGSIDEISSTEWHKLIGTDNPFLRHEFLAALEHSNCVGPATGWLPMHLVARNDADEVLGALPLYLKHDSWGEFVFDWAWAHAWQQAGMSYYPKLVSAVPFSPVTGRRILLHPGSDTKRVTDSLLEYLKQLAEEHVCSSVHCLFPDGEELPQLEQHGFLTRRNCQYHWHNRQYRDFDNFLAAFTAEKRKKIRRERRRIKEAGITFRLFHGEELDAALLDDLFRFYSITYLIRGRTPYLNKRFFTEIARTLPKEVVVVMALRNSASIAAALSLHDGATLYGRHWGADADYHSLHFETCYYQGIEYCIQHGLQHFEPGTQGEHKISRGFEPVVTWSSHWIKHPLFRKAIADFLRRESPAITNYAQEAKLHLPFRRGAY